MVIFESFAKEMPWLGCNAGQIAMKVCVQRERPALPDSTPAADLESSLGKRMHALMVQCWAQEPGERPAFKQIVQALESALQHHQQEQEQAQLAEGAPKTRRRKKTR